jgi:Holliday junction resolvase RusA-like endonuclease
VTGLTFDVRAIPSPQGSKSYKGHRGGKPILVESAGQSLKDWRTAVRVDCVAAMKDTRITGWGGPIHVLIAFHMPRPRSHYRTGKHAHELRPNAPTYSDKRPDIDKLIRSTLDALTAAGIYMDDGQVARLEVDQLYADPQPVGAVVTVGPLR